MNKVSCTTGLAVGFGASVDAVVLVMLSLKQSLYSIVAGEEKTGPEWSLFEEQRTRTTLVLSSYNVLQWLCWVMVGVCAW